jgi:C_GCAxxG_C_C family probable redox protein
MPAPSDTAVALFSDGYSCSQAVLAAFARDLGLEHEAALKLASAFGGGIGRRGDVCGAVSGALMALGLALGHSGNDDASKDATVELVRSFLERFEAAHGSVTCRTLIGHSDSPEGRQKARDAGVFQSICPALVADAARLVSSVLDEARVR